MDDGLPLLVQEKRHRDEDVAHVASSDIVGLQRILRRTSAQDHIPGTERPKLVNEDPKDQAVAARKCERQKPRHVGCLPRVTITCLHVLLVDGVF